jgi:hypothetical protein
MARFNYGPTSDPERNPQFRRAWLDPPVQNEAAARLATERRRVSDAGPARPAMRLVKFTPVATGGSTLAYLDIELGSGLVLRECRLMRGPNGVLDRDAVTEGD